MDNSEMLVQIAEMIERQSTEMKIFIENQVAKRIDSLFDGYKLTHEKQWELERRTEILQSQLEEMQDRLAALEHKIA